MQIRKEKKNKKEFKSDKSLVLVKTVRAKLTGTWEGGGVGGKKYTKKNLDQVGPYTPPPPLGNRVNLYPNPPTGS